MLCDEDRASAVVGNDAEEAGRVGDEPEEAAAAVPGKYPCAAEMTSILRSESAPNCTVTMLASMCRRLGLSALPISTDSRFWEGPLAVCIPQV